MSKTLKPEGWETTVCKKECRNWKQLTVVLFPTLPHLLDLGKSLNDLEPQFPHLTKGSPSTKDHCLMLCGSLDRRGVWGRMYTFMCMAESLFCLPETITTLLIGYIQYEFKSVLYVCVYI